MESKNLFLFIFIFLINTKVLVYSEDYGYILLNYSDNLSVRTDGLCSGGYFCELDIKDSGCNISLKYSYGIVDYFFKAIFTDTSNIKTIDLTNLRIIPKTLRGMFLECNGLTEIKGLSYLNTSEVEYMSEMFLNCSKLETLNLSNFDTSLVKDMSRMFTNCIGLNTLDISNFNTSLVTSMTYMFHNCSSLKTLNLSV